MDGKQKVLLSISTADTAASRENLSTLRAC